MGFFTLLTASRRVLGINSRNFEFIGPSNRRAAIRVADNKLLAKRVLAKAGIPVAQTYAVFRNRHDVRSFSWEGLPNSFVIKPNAGLGGSGIIIVFGKKKLGQAPPAGGWIEANHQPITVPLLQEHAYNILDGMYSLANLPDAAFIEERVKIHPALKPYSFRGIPDIRVIVYNNVPVMAMLRLPTKQSGGKANLALGGIAAGIDLATGVTTAAIIGKGKPIETVPGERLRLSGIDIPFWQKILRLAVQSQQAAGLKFLGVDIAIDKDFGPKVLEINARPGLSIQLANRAPLRERLQRIRGLKVESVEKGVAIGQSLFTKKVPEGLGALTDKKIVGPFEPIVIGLSKNKEHHIMAKLDTGAYSSSIDRALAEKLGLTQQIAYEKKAWSSFGAEKRPFIELTFLLKGEVISTIASLADRSQSRYDVLIGRRDLHHFLIDPSRKRANAKPLTKNDKQPVDA